MRIPLLLICLLYVTGCAEKSPVGPTPAIGERFTLAPGETALVAAPGLGIQFVEVSGDSRCPAGALCIQGGDAAVQIQVSGGGVVTTSYELHTGDTSKATVSHGRFQVTLVELQPYPFSSHAIAPEEYRATLLVTTS